MSNELGSRSGRGLWLALLAAAIGAAAGAGAVLWSWKGATPPGPMGVAEDAGNEKPSGVCGGKVKFYRNPMGAPDTSLVPKKDSMGMDYIPVCEEGGEKISVELTHGLN